MERVEISCLKWIGDQPSNAKIVSLENKNEVGPNQLTFVEV